MTNPGETNSVETTVADAQHVSSGGAARRARRLVTWSLGLVTAVLFCIGCGAQEASDRSAPELVNPLVGQGGVAAAATGALATPTPVATGTTSPVPGPLIEDGIDVLLDEVGLPSDDATVDRLREELANSLLPAGTPVTDEVVAQALAARLGPNYANERDLVVLLSAVSAELDPGSPIDSLDALVRSVAEWANTGVVTFGPSAGGQPAITSTTSFDQAVEIIERSGTTIDVLDGLASFEVAGVTIDVDQAQRRIRIDGVLPAPLGGSVVVTLTWSDAGPEFMLEARPGTVRLGVLAPNDLLGELGQVGVTDLVFQLDSDGITAAGAVDVAAIPGLGELGLGAQALPAEFVSSGFGPWTRSGTAQPISVSVPLLGLAPLGDWNLDRVGSIDLALAADPTVGYSETLTARLGDETLVFQGTGIAGSNGLEVALALQGEWVAPFDASWLTLRDVVLTTRPGGSGQTAMITGGYTLGAKRGVLEFALDSGDATRVRATGTLDDLTATDLTDIAIALTGGALLPAGTSLPPELLALRDVRVAFAADETGDRVTLSATSQLLGQTADAVLSTVPAQDGGTVAIVAVQPRNVTLAELFPVLAGNDIVGDLALPDSAFVFTSRDVRTAADGIDPALVASVDPAGSGQVQLAPGINLAAGIPGGLSPALDDLKETLGIDRGAPLELSGTVPVGALNGSGGTFALRASLPPMAPAGNPEWFVSSQLSLQITDTSVSVVGSLTIDVQGDVQTFEIEASIQRELSGVSVSFVGRLGNPWESPFDVEWLTLNQVVLELGLHPVRGVSMAFLGDIRVGTKDLRGSVELTISPAGVPSNFGFSAASVEGVSLSDLADVYALVSGQARPPVESALPAIELRDIALRFSPRGNAALGIEQGFRVAGELWMASSVGGPLMEIVDADVELSDIGLRADVFLGRFDLDPVVLDQTTLLLVAGPTDQRLSFSGGIEIAGSAAQVTVAASPTELAFATTGTFGGSEATLEVAATYDLTNPEWSVRVIMNEQFIRDVDAATARLIGSEISDLNSQIGTARTGLGAAELALEASQLALRAAQAAASGCRADFLGPLNPCVPLQRAVDNAQRDVDNDLTRVRNLRAQLDRAEELLEQFDIQLTVVGAEFEAEFSAIGNNQVSMNLIVSANGNRVPVPVEWDFEQTIDANVSGLLDQVPTLG